MKKILPACALIFFSLLATATVSRGAMLSATALSYTSSGTTQTPPAVRYLLPPRAEWSGDSLRVRFASEVTGELKGPVSLHVVPVYISGGDTIRYPEVGYFSPSGAKYHKRREALAEEKTSGTVHIIWPRSAGRGDIDYRRSMLIPTRAEGRLQVLLLSETCAGSRLLARQDVEVPSRSIVIPDTVRVPVEVPADMLPLPVAAVSVPLFETNVTFIKPQAETIKERTATATIRITYPVDHSKVYPDFGDNAAELARVDTLLAPVASDTGTYRVLDASIVGYASPEGTYKHNLGLSDRRAGGIRDYLQQQYGFPAGKIAAEGRGEDWDGLREAVVESDMPDKDEVLAIIDGYDIFDGREKLLMDLRGGHPYKYMLNELFPPLRRMELTLRYRVRPFLTDEAGELIGSRPQDLSLDEMYRVAQAQNDDAKIQRRRSEYGHEYDIAVRYFPDDDIANINASWAALVRGDLELAWVCLGRVKNNPLAANNLGVYHWLCGKIPEARAYFEKAMASDPERATYNLEQLSRWEEEFGGDTDKAPRTDRQTVDER